jgi:mRNA interferase RelE/StbE
VKFTIVISELAQATLNSVTDRGERANVIEKIDGLAEDPEKQGKSLVAELAGFRSVRAAGQLYRIVYQVKEQQVTVHVVAVGQRQAGSKRDIYKLARKLLDQRLVKPPKRE